MSIRASADGWWRGLLRRVPVDRHGQASIGPRQIYILPTKAGFSYGALLFATLLGALNYQNNLGLLLTFVMGAVSLVSMHHTWFNLLRLRVRAHAGAPVFCGQPARFAILLEDDRQRPRPDIRVRGGSAASVPAGGAARLELALPTTQRGSLPLGEIQLETRHPLGLFRAWSLVRVDAVGLVYPRPAARASEPPLLASVDPNAKGDQGIGADDYVGPRAYRPGDSPRQIDWKALARERGLVVKQFGGDRAARIWLDWSRLPPSDTETRLSLLCRQVLIAAEQNLVFGLRLPGLTIERAQGDAQKHRCLAALARFGHAR